jgi:hypothetical protein
MKFLSHLSVSSQKWLGIGENDIRDDQLTPWIVGSPQSMFLGNVARTSRNGADMTLRHLKFYA